MAIRYGAIITAPGEYPGTDKAHVLVGWWTTKRNEQGNLIHDSVSFFVNSIEEIIEILDTAFTNWHDCMQSIAKYEAQNGRD